MLAEIILPDGAAARRRRGREGGRARGGGKGRLNSFATALLLSLARPRSHDAQDPIRAKGGASEIRSGLWIFPLPPSLPPLMEESVAAAQTTKTLAVTR